MDNVNFSSESLPPQPISWGHFGVIVLAAAALLGMTWLEKPQLFSFHNNQLADVAQVHYVPYVPPASDQPQPAVLGASTNQGPEIIGDDGTVQPVDMGEVLGASTQDVQLSLDSIKVNAIADSDAAIKKYFSDSQAIEGDSVNSTDFAAALNSGDQNQITAQAQKIMGISQALQKLAVPQSLVKLQKLKIIQYNSAADMLQNFTGANSNPDQINNDFQQFLKSQQDLDDENIAVAQKFPQDDPLSSLYLNPDGTPAVSQAAIDNFGSSNSLPAPDAGSNNSDNGNAGE